MVLWEQFFLILAPMIFLLKFLLKRFGVEIRFWSYKIAAICGAVERSSIVFCNSVSADRSGMAASRVLLASICGAVDRIGVAASRFPW